MKPALRWMTTAALAISLAIPQAPAMAKVGKRTGTTAGSAKVAKPSPTRSKYSRKKVRRVPRRSETSLARAKQGKSKSAKVKRYKTRKIARSRQAMASQLMSGGPAGSARVAKRPGMLSRARNVLDRLFSRKPKVQVLEGSVRSVHSARLGRLQRTPGGKLVVRSE